MHIIVISVHMQRLIGQGAQSFMTKNIKIVIFQHFNRIPCGSFLVSAPMPTLAAFWRQADADKENLADSVIIVKIVIIFKIIINAVSKSVGR